MQRRDFLKQSGAALAVASMAKPASTFAAETAARPLNLLFITVDDMNSTLPGFMGNKNNLTPNLDALAARSHRFVNNRTTAPICQPSREAMMTGLVPHRSGGLGFTPIKDGTPTLVTILKAHNYYTAAVHKIEHMQPESCFPWDSKVPGMARNTQEYADAVSHAIAEAKRLDRPFFINCNINDPHRPFYGSPEAAEFDHQDTGDYGVAKELQPEDVEVPAFLEDLPPIRKEFSQYCNSAQRMDISIGKVLDQLNASSEADNTIVFFSADHGMPFPFSKATVYNNGSRTPALISWPKMGKPRTFEDLTCNVDYLPTLLELLHVPAPDGIDGRSWGTMMQGKKQKNREYVVTHINTLSSGMAYPMRAIQNQKYSLVFSPWSNGEFKYRAESMTGLTYNAMAEAAKTDPRIAARVKQYIMGIPLAFYDLQSDPGERVNAIDAPEHRAEVAKMKDLLLAAMKRTGDPQLENFQTLLAGGKPVVVQPPRQQHQAKD